VLERAIGIRIDAVTKRKIPTGLISQYSVENHSLDANI
jgi:hypothetical protein